jgi:3',5'-cyclic AMP phosphodiesterase CpdA
MLLTRRHYLQISGLTAGALWLRPEAGQAAEDALTPAPHGAFSFILLGDMHFGRPHHYEAAHMDSYARKICDLTAATWDALWEEVTAQVRTLEPRPAFVLQVGDYVHGDCPTPDKSLEHYADFVTSIRRHKLPVPLFLTRGNHELQGKGVRAAYEAHMPAYLREVAPLTRGAAYYSFDAGPAAHVTVLDVYGRGGRGGSLDAEQFNWLEADLAAFRQRSPDGIVMVVSHAPLFPMMPRGAVFDADPDAHRKLLALLIRHRVSTVLCGHLHTVSTLTYTDPASGHRLSQVMAYSMPGPGEVKPHGFRKPTYSPDIIEAADYRTPEDLAAMRAIAAATAPHITGYRLAQIPGYQVVRVDPKKGIIVESFAGLGKRAFDVFEVAV